MIVVDTTVWVDLLRGAQTAAAKQVRRLLLEEETCIVPVVLQEILQGARSEADLSLLRERFSALPMIEHSATTYALAGTLYARYRWAGVTPRSPHDCLTAAAAIEHGVPLLHDDRDFELIAEIEPGLRLVAV